MLAASYALAGEIEDARLAGAEMKRLFPHYCAHRSAVGLGFIPEFAARYDDGLNLANVI